MKGDEKEALLSDVTFEKFRRLARHDQLSRFEKIGFYNALRDGHEGLIFEDILNKLTQLRDRNKRVLDIGPGCSDLPGMLIDHCQRQGHELLLIDSSEMLDLLPEGEKIIRIPGRFPDGCQERVTPYHGSVDAILIYSVFHYVYREMNYLTFVDHALKLLAPGGQMLIGDIPNSSRFKRFFSSEAGIRHHQAQHGSDDKPQAALHEIRDEDLDDAALMAILMRARASGFNAYVMPQDNRLPMAGRREDILIERP